jgi:TolA-binding protein
MGIGSGMLQTYLKHKERLAVLRASGAQEMSEDIRGELLALRGEISRLRDTSTQFDMSIDHTLKDLQARVETIESRRTSYKTPIENESAEPLRLKQS